MSSFFPDKESVKELDDAICADAVVPVVAVTACAGGADNDSVARDAKAEAEGSED